MYLLPFHAFVVISLFYKTMEYQYSKDPAVDIISIIVCAIQRVLEVGRSSLGLTLINSESVLLLLKDT